MAEQWQIRRGNTTENNDFTGAEGELTMDTQAKEIRFHDGATQGGFKLAKQATIDAADYVVDWQVPTSANNHTWFRKYKSGWVEQGGYAVAGQYNNGTVVNLPVTMRNTFYTVLVAPQSQGHWSDDAMYNRESVSQIKIYAGFNGVSGQSAEVSWYVCGQAA